MIKLKSRDIRFLARVESKNPEVIKKQKKPFIDEYSFDSFTLKGDFYRVVPVTPKEVLFLASLEKYVDKWAPAKGNGIIIRSQIIDHLATV